MMASVTSRLINIFILTQDEMKHLPEKQPFDEPGRPRIVAPCRYNLLIIVSNWCIYARHVIVLAPVNFLDLKTI